MIEVSDIIVTNLKALEYAGLPFSKSEPPIDTLKKLANSNQRSHAKFLRQINISFVVKAPAYWWTEFDTYKIGVTRMSTSTMHTLLKTHLTLHGFLGNDKTNPFVAQSILNTIKKINKIKEDYNLDDTQKLIEIKKILPMSFHYTSFVTINYESLRTIYADRINHKLPEWKEFLNEFKEIPYFNEFIVPQKKLFSKTKIEEILRAIPNFSCCFRCEHEDLKPTEYPCVECFDARRCLSLKDELYEEICELLEV